MCTIIRCKQGPSFRWDLCERCKCANKPVSVRNLSHPVLPIIYCKSLSIRQVAWPLYVHVCVCTHCGPATHSPPSRARLGKCVFQVTQEIACRPLRVKFDTSQLVISYYNTSTGVKRSASVFTRYIIIIAKDVIGRFSFFFTRPWKLHTNTSGLYDSQWSFSQWIIGHD